LDPKGIADCKDTASWSPNRHGFCPSSFRTNVGRSLKNTVEMMKYDEMIWDFYDLVANLVAN